MARVDEPYEVEMYTRKKLSDGTTIAISMSHHTERRLATKCFRGTSRRLAGNFQLWNNARDFIRDDVVLRQLLAEIEELWPKEDFGRHSFYFTYPCAVGWESTAPLADYDPDTLESFALNSHAHGLRVKTEHTEIVAPKTRELTIVFDFNCFEDKPVCIVGSLYPGRDVGDLDGDVTDREQRVFFDWSHPGED